jgi:hypothetical protein
MGLRIKNVILRGTDIHKFPLESGLEKRNILSEGENYCSLTGTKQQINNYLQTAAKDIISERCRTLNSVPKYRIIQTHRTEIY